MKNKLPTNSFILRSDVREAIAIFLYGMAYTTEQLKAIAVFDNGRWFKYNIWGDWSINRFNRIVVGKDSPGTKGSND